MATPKKQRIDETQKETTFDCNQAVGYIHKVSPMKKSAKGFNYFNAKVQEQDKITDLVGYREKLHTDLQQLENQRTPVKLTNIDRVPSWKTPGNFDIKLTTRSHIAPVSKLSFCFETPDLKELQPKQIKIMEVKEVPINTKVTVTAQVVKKQDTTVHSLKYNNKTMQLTTYVVADETGEILLDLWGPPEQVRIGCSYTFTNVTIRFYEQKKISTNSDTSIKKTEALKNVSQERLFRSVTDTIEIVGVTIQTETKCCFCSSTILVNQELQSVKCNSCNKRQLIDAVTKSTKCELMGKKKDDSISQFILASDVLQQLTPTTTSDEDKELHLLMMKHVEITLTSENSNFVTQLKEIKSVPKI